MTSITIRIVKLKKLGRIFCYPQCALSRAIAEIKNSAKSLTVEDVISLNSAGIEVYYSGVDIEDIVNIGGIKVRDIASESEVSEISYSDIPNKKTGRGPGKGEKQ